MKSYQRRLVFLALTTASLGLSAADLDATAPMLCAVTHTVACDSAGDCVDGAADAFNLPVFLKIDSANKVVVSAKGGGERRTSKILKINTEGDGIVLTGFEKKGGWNAVIDKATGKMTVSAAEQGVGYLVFGSCLNP